MLTFAGGNRPDRIAGREAGLPADQAAVLPGGARLYMCPTIVTTLRRCARSNTSWTWRGEYAKLGSPNNTGTRIVSLQRQRQAAGYYEVEVGKVTIRELVFDLHSAAGCARVGH